VTTLEEAQLVEIKTNAEQADITDVRPSIVRVDVVGVDVSES
jgi:hypothetical protein